MMTVDNNRLRLSSISPFEDAMLPLNKGYYICGGIGAIFGIIGGIGGAILIGLLGAFLWWIIKANIALQKWKNLRFYKFCMETQPPYESLIEMLIPAITSCGLRIDCGKDGNPEVSFKNVRIKIDYNNDGTFSMPWKQNAGLLFFDSRYIASYKNTVAVMSIIGYHVQKSCLKGHGQESEVMEKYDGQEFKFCAQCGRGSNAETLFCGNCGYNFR